MRAFRSTMGTNGERAGITRASRILSGMRNQIAKGQRLVELLAVCANKSTTGLPAISRAILLLYKPSTSASRATLPLSNATPTR